jgi:hypothetical protein
VQFDGRICVKQAEVAGVTIEPGNFVMMLIGAGNRDPAAFDDPGRFDVTCGATNHIAFGYGIHFCLGAPLARLEGQIALRSLTQRFPKLHLESNELRYRNQITIRGLAELRVAWQGPGRQRQRAPFVSPPGAFSAYNQPRRDCCGEETYEWLMLNSPYH